MAGSSRLSLGRVPPVPHTLPTAPKPVLKLDDRWALREEECHGSCCVHAKNPTESREESAGAIMAMLALFANW
ncbi:hypothetical protein M407DRAFT_34958 [Tulasnella calospora MUT 4182]|uniref:Uncharacterized protein n=1 Tax=Tulasnella calospora MUT 4182 TaxID=1051891 RepID=A0A0C3K216_9AGAM|nr:hypothetical protein M407DRAFT_34958 [Tulasnella calospora MUT 4182]